MYFHLICSLFFLFYLISFHFVNNQFRRLFIVSTTRCNCTHSVQCSTVHCSPFSHFVLFWPSAFAWAKHIIPNLNIVTRTHTHTHTNIEYYIYMLCIQHSLSHKCCKHIEHNTDRLFGFAVAVQNHSVVDNHNEYCFWVSVVPFNCSIWKCGRFNIFFFFRIHARIVYSCLLFNVSINCLDN